MTNTPNPFDKNESEKLLAQTNPTPKSEPRKRPRPSFETAPSNVTPIRTAHPPQVDANPFVNINPDDQRLKSVSADIRIRAKALTMEQVNAISNSQNKLSYEDAIDEIAALDGRAPPTDAQLYRIISGSKRGRVSDPQINDVIDRINKKWKSCTKKILKEMLGTVIFYVDFTGAQKDNEPGKRIIPACNVTDQSHEFQVAFATAGLGKKNSADPRLYRYGEELARLHHTPEEGSLRAEMVNKDGLRAEINRCCKFEKTKQDESYQGVSAPMDVVSDVYQNTSLPLPYLRQIGTYPVFDENVNLIATDGYHSNAYLYLRLPDNLQMQHVSEQPNTAEIAEAKRILIEEYLADFPFDGYSRQEILIACGIHPANGEAAKPVPPSLLSLLAFLLQPILRPVIGKSPMPALFVTKPAAGSGATKLVETAQLIVMGQTSTRAAMPNSDEERRKVIFSALRGGNPFMLFDNVTGAIDSPVLAALLTSVMFTDRVLGKSEERTIPNLASVAITGNNPTLSRELLRRVSLCRLDAGVAEPDKRVDFHHEDLEGWVAENRGQLLWALCTLIANWKAMGRVEPSGPALASYGPWFKTCGGVLRAAGWGGFQSNRGQLEQVASSGDEDPIRDLVNKWFEMAMNSASQYDLECQYVGGDHGLAALADSAELSLPDVKRKNVDGEIRFDAKSLGLFLNSKLDNVYAIDPDTNVRLHSDEKTKFGKPWSLVVTKSDPNA
jgi:hypothetical protein